MQIHTFDRDERAEIFPAGHTIFRPGELGQLMYAVVEGTVNITIHNKKVEVVGPGGVFGEMGIVAEEGWTHLALAVVESTAKLVVIDRTRFIFLVQQHPYFALQVMEVMAERLRRMDEKL